MSHTSPIPVFKTIKSFFFDVDGVFTNNELICYEDQDLVRTMHAKDGLALAMAMMAGYHICIITGGSSMGVEKRLRKFGLHGLYTGVRDKSGCILKHAAEKNVDLNTALYLGDDLTDIPAMQHVALPASPKDASWEVHQASTYISPKKGGHGCVKDVIQRVLKSNGHWM